MLSEDHEPEAPATFSVELMTGTSPDPAAVVAVTLELVGAGLVPLLPVRKFQVAID